MSPSSLALFAAALSLGLGVSPPSHVTVAREAQKLLDRAVPPEGPGVAVLIAIGDEVIFRGARGRAEIELGVPLTPDHVFRIASVTKTFTAATILKLAEAGKLSLDDALARYLPDFPNAARMTIRQLLSHTAGISDVITDRPPGLARPEIDRGVRIAEIGKRPLDFPPGSSWRYSNAGYITLGAVIEKITGEPWYITLEKQLLIPLGLKHTQYGDAARLIPGRVAGYTTDTPNHAVTNADFVSAAVPDSAGALVSSVDDLLLWMRALSSGRAISREGFRQMVTPAPVGSSVSTSYRYGLGMLIWQVRGTTMIGHTGQIPGFASVVAYLPQHDITIVALGNDDNFDARTMGRRLAAIAMGTPYPDVVAVPASDAQLQTLEGTYRIDASTLQTLFVKDRRLYARRGNRNAISLQVTADEHLHFDPDELSYFVPVRDADGRVGRLDYYPDGDGPPQPLPRVSNESR